MRPLFNCSEQRTGPRQPERGTLGEVSLWGNYTTDSHLCLTAKADFFRLGHQG